MQNNLHSCSFAAEIVIPAKRRPLASDFFRDESVGKFFWRKFHINEVE